VTKISRRRFSFEAAAIAATSLSSATGALGEGLGTQEKETQGKTPEATDLGLTTEQVREVDARFSNVIRDFGDRLSDEQRQRVRRILVYNEKMLASIHAFDVETGDPPASVLKYIEDGSGAR